MVNASIAAVLGLGSAIGIVGLAWVLRPQHHPDRSSRAGKHSLTSSKSVGKDATLRSLTRQAAIPTGFGLLCVVITRWPVAGILGAAAMATLPKSLRRVRPGSTSKRTEAVAAWTELIRDSLAASAGLAQAIVVTASSAPLPIRKEVGALATRLANGTSLEAAFRAFAIDVDEPAAEYLVCALLLAATSRAHRLVDVLSALADSIREDVSMHLRVDASRASAQSSVRTIVLFSVVFACALALVGRSYLSPFGTAAGQLVLAIVGIFYGVGLTLMIRLVRPVSEMRLLDSELAG